MSDANLIARIVRHVERRLEVREGARVRVPFVLNGGAAFGCETFRPSYSTDLQKNPSAAGSPGGPMPSPPASKPARAGHAVHVYFPSRCKIYIFRLILLARTTGGYVAKRRLPRHFESPFGARYMSNREKKRTIGASASGAQKRPTSSFLRPPSRAFLPARGC
jgi:hypothetical protein